MGEPQYDQLEGIEKMEGGPCHQWRGNQ